MSNAIPAYVSGPIDRCFNSLINLAELLHMSMRGISVVCNFPKMDEHLIDLTIKAEKEVTDKLRTQLEESKRLASFADREANHGFPFLNAFSTVAAWGTLEVAVEDALLGILINEPESLNAEAITKIRVPLAKYEALDKEERMRFILQELARGQAITIGQGVSAFENLLCVFGLSGEVDDGVKKSLWEMNHVRNIVVHRDSLADQRFVQACPWMNVKPGDRVLIDHERFWRYIDAVSGYLKSLRQRVGKRYLVST